MQKELGIKNPHAVPRLEKIIVSTGINKSKMDSKEMRAYIEESLTKITGQKPVQTQAKKAISNFKTRVGMIVGTKVTLRGKQMEEFLDRLLSYALPRIRDFRGLPSKLDGQGNYAIGLRDHSIFPEVPPPEAKQIFGLQIQIKTTAKDDTEGMALLKALCVPFRPKKTDEKKQKTQETQENQKSSASTESASDAENNDETTNNEDSSESSASPDSPASS